MKIKDLPISEKPRERFLSNGVTNLSNEELLAILMRVGTRELSVKELSLNILKTINTLKELDDLTINKLTEIKGVGEVKAMSIIAALELGKRVYLNQEIKKIKLSSSDKTYEMFKDKFKFITQEKLVAIYLDQKNQIIEYKTIFMGTVNSSIVHPREIFKEALKLSASKIIIVHNHPSGDPTPSINDIIFTNKVIKTGEIMSIPIIDHIIIGNNNYSSYLDNNWEIRNGKEKD